MRACVAYALLVGFGVPVPLKSQLKPTSDKLMLAVATATTKPGLWSFELFGCLIVAGLYFWNQYFSPFSSSTVAVCVR